MLVSKHSTGRRRKDEFPHLARQTPAVFTEVGRASPRCPGGLSPLRQPDTLIMQWGRNSKPSQGLNIASQATCRNAPEFAKSRGLACSAGNYTLFQDQASQAEPDGPQSFL